MSETCAPGHLRLLRCALDHLLRRFRPFCHGRCQKPNQRIPWYTGILYTWIQTYTCAFLKYMGMVQHTVQHSNGNAQRQGIDKENNHQAHKSAYPLQKQQVRVQVSAHRTTHAHVPSASHTSTQTRTASQHASLANQQPGLQRQSQPTRGQWRHRTFLPNQLTLAAVRCPVALGLVMKKFTLEPDTQPLRFKTSARRGTTEADRYVWPTIADVQSSGWNVTDAVVQFRRVKSQSVSMNGSGLALASA
jgi:hypothetical protein